MRIQFHDRSPLGIALLCLMGVVTVSMAGCDRGEEANQPTPETNANQPNPETKANRPTPEKLTLYSIYRHPIEQPVKGPDGFHSYRILGKIEVSTPAARKEIFDALHDGIDQSDGTQIQCFEPRHGIRTVEAGRKVDYVICYTCRNMYIYRDDKRAKLKTTTRGPRSVFDKHLNAAKIPLAPPRKD